MEIIIRPVGIVKNNIKEPNLIAGDTNINRVGRKEEMKRRHSELIKSVSDIIINDEHDGILDGIEDFSHILVLYWPHLLPEKSRSLVKVHPMGNKDLPVKGIFATCSPARPNPILVTAVPLLLRTDNVLKVQGLEAMDGSPVIDIKPYSPNYYNPKDVVLADWMQNISEELNDIS